MSDPKSTRKSDRPTMPPPPGAMNPRAMNSGTMPGASTAMTNPPVSHERPKSLDVDEEEIPELLRGVTARPPVRVPSNRPPPNVTRIATTKQKHTFVEEVVLSRKDPRRED